MSMPKIIRGTDDGLAFMRGLFPQPLPVLDLGARKGLRVHIAPAEMSHIMMEGRRTVDHQTQYYFLIKQAGYVDIYMQTLGTKKLGESWQRYVSKGALQNLVIVPVITEGAFNEDAIDYLKRTIKVKET